MAGRPKIFDQEIAIERASELFQLKGYKSTSLEELINVMQIQRGSFYNTFGSKKELFLEIIKRYDTKSLNDLRKSLDETENPIELIKSIFLKLASNTSNKTIKGCFAGNTIVELDCTDKELTNQAKLHLMQLEQIFIEQIELAKTKNRVNPNANSKFIGNYLLNLWNGLNITRRIYPASEELKKQVEFQLALLN